MCSCLSEQPISTNDSIINLKRYFTFAFNNYRFNYLMVQTYKILLRLLLICGIVLSGTSCQKKIYPTSYPNKPGFFPITIPFKEYRLHKRSFESQNRLNRDERRIKRKADRNKRLELKDQKAARKKHINQQNPKVQERMKKSFEESEQTRRKKSFWDRLMFWKRGKSKEKRLK